MTRRTRSKFGNIPTEVDGYRFDSKKEAARYQELKLLHKAGEIELPIADKKLLRFPIEVYGHKICVYEADFMYHRRASGGGLELVVEDCKGFKTPEYKLKKKLLKACRGIEIQEV